MMDEIYPRRFRIRQLDVELFVAEEERRTWPGWRRLNYSGKLQFDATCCSLKSAREAIRLRKERLVRADEFPVTIEEHEWDGTDTGLRLVG